MERACEVARRRTRAAVVASVRIEKASAVTKEPCEFARDLVAAVLARDDTSNARYSNIHPCSRH